MKGSSEEWKFSLCISKLTSDTYLTLLSSGL